MAEQAGGSYSLEISLVAETPDPIFSVEAKGFGLSDGQVQWLINGFPVESPVPSQFKPKSVRRGDTIQVRATLQNKEILSSIITIKNSPPRIENARILPEIIGQRQALSVDATAIDKDGDAVSLSYEWTRNGEPAGNEKRLGALVNKGDKISVRVTPFDGEAYGRRVVLEREIKNLPPTIIDDKKFSFDGRVYTYQVRASDPEGDPITYSLISGPKGMTIDPSTGLVRWDVPPAFVGRSAFIVCVTDGYGGECRQNLTFEIRPEKK